MTNTVINTVAIASGAALGLVTGLYPFMILGALVNRDVTDEHTILEFQNIIAPGVYDQIKDERLRFVTATAALEIKRMCDSNTNITWSQLEKVMNECVMVEKGDDSTVNKLETKTLNDLEDVEDKVGYLKLWFRDLVEKADPDVYESMRLKGDEIDSVLDIILKDVGVHGFLSLFASSIHAKKDILDIGFLRFPTDVQPYVKLYRIRVSSSADGVRVLFFGGGMEARVSVELTSRKYYPRMDMFKAISSDVIASKNRIFEKALKN
jgi:hypothetical protein